MELINNNQVSEGYKKTEAGVIPEDWEAKLLGDIFSLKNGFSFKSEYFSASGPIVLTPGNFKLDGGLYFNDRNIKRYSGLFPESMIFKNGDLLVVMTDLTPDCNLLGKPAFVDSEETILHNQRIGKINLLSESIDPNFLYFILLSSPYLKKIKEQATGSTVRHTSNKSIYSISLPIPKTKEEQKAIAQTLSDVDTLIAALDKLIAKKRNIKTATMQQLLTGKTRLPGFGEGKGYKKTEVGVIPEDWEVDYLGEYAEVTKLAGFEYTNYFNSYRDGGEIIVIRGVNITNNTLNLEDVKTIPKATSNKLPRSQLKKNDLVFAYVGTIGPVFLIEQSGKYHLGPNTARITPKNMVIPQFLFFYFKSNLLESEINEKISIGAQPSLSMLKIRSFKIIKPPIPEQQAIAQVLSDIDTEITALEKRRAKTQAIKQGMMQELLTGRTRLINN